MRPRLNLFAASTLALATTFGQGAVAADMATCVAYARTSVGQNDAAIGNGCGFGGPRWQSNFNAHNLWCLGQPEATVRAEVDARADQLATCTGQHWPNGTHRRCHIIALLAVAQYQAGVEARCAFTGSLWSPSYDMRYATCVNETVAKSNGEAAARTAQLAQCAPWP
ncbi:MAG: hypothetical protein R3F55_18575 [Alphaproteobacteria bacterium]